MTGLIPQTDLWVLFEVPYDGMTFFMRIVGVLSGVKPLWVVERVERAVGFHVMVMSGWRRAT